jgi:hypothetical protein
MVIFEMCNAFRSETMRLYGLSLAHTDPTLHIFIMFTYSRAIGMTGLRQR